MNSSQGKISGSLSGVYLHDIIQLLGMTGRTVTVLLHDRRHRGRMFFRNGDLLHAEADSVEGEEAVVELLSWSGAHFVIEDGIRGIPRESITNRTEAVVLSAVARLDELNRDRDPSPPRPPEMPPDVPAPSRVPTAPPPEPARAAFRASARAPVRVRRRRRTKSWALFNLSLAALAIPVVLAFLPLDDLLEVPVELPAPVLPSRETPPPPWVRWIPPKADPILDEMKSADPSPPPTERSSAPDPTAAPAVRPELGALRLIVDPWAEVFLNGKRLGETPLREIRLAAGEHLLALANGEYAGLIRDRITILPSQNVVKRYSFRDSGMLRVVVRPWAELYVDGRRVGETPLRDLKVPAGEHTLVFHHPERGERRRTVWIETGRTTVVRVDM